MRTEYIIGFGSLLATFAFAQPCAAQVAAEEAVILSGTGSGTGEASREMGNAVRGSISSANDALSAINSRRSSAQRRRTPARGTPRQSSGRNVGYWITSDVDALDRYAVPTFRMNNGAILKVSGTLHPTRDATCLRNCFVG